jgi:TonB family protein
LSSENCSLIMNKEPYRSLLLTLLIYIVFFTILIVIELDINIFPNKKIEAFELIYQSGNSNNQSNIENTQPKSNNLNPEQQTDKKITSYPLASNFNTVPINMPDTTLKDIDTTGSGNDSSAILNNGGPGSVFSYGDYMLSELPSFEGGSVEKFREWLAKSTRANKIVIKNKMSGTIVITFIIDRNGEVIDVTVQRGINDELNAEVVNIIKSSPRWLPGKQQGHPVKVLYRLPLIFTN